MKFWKQINVAEHERAWVFRHNKLSAVLEAGQYRLWDFKGSIQVQLFDISGWMITEAKVKWLYKKHADLLSDVIESFDLAEHQVGLLYRDELLAAVIPPSSNLMVWKGVESVRLERIDIADHFSIDEKLYVRLKPVLDSLSSLQLAKTLLQVEVPDEQVGLLSINGKLQQKLLPGRYAYWKFNRAVVVRLVDLRMQTVEVGGQEILTKDRVSLRINLSASYRVIDAKTVALNLKDYEAFIYQELQLRLREAVGTKTLDQLLENKDSLNSDIAGGVNARFSGYGIELLGVGVKDIILPGDMKLILNRVVEAQKEAESNLIRRREETQAMRSLHNTAKLMENNPVLLRLKELEALERVSARIDSITVYGGLDAVLNDLVRLAPVKAGA